MPGNYAARSDLTRLGWQDLLPLRLGATNPAVRHARQAGNPGVSRGQGCRQGSAAGAAGNRGSNMGTASGMRWAIPAAILSVGLGTIGVLLVGETPRADASGEQIVSWLRENGQMVRWSVWFLTAASPFF